MSLKLIKVHLFTSVKVDIIALGYDKSHWDEGQSNKIKSSNFSSEAGIPPGKLVLLYALAALPDISYRKTSFPLDTELSVPLEWFQNCNFTLSIDLRVYYLWLQFRIGDLIKQLFPKNLSWEEFELCICANPYSWLQDFVSIMTGWITKLCVMSPLGQWRCWLWKQCIQSYVSLLFNLRKN